MNNLYFIRGDLQGIYYTIIIQEQMLGENIVGLGQIGNIYVDKRDL